MTNTTSATCSLPGCSSGLENAVLGSIEASIPGCVAFIASYREGTYEVLSNDERLSAALAPHLQVHLATPEQVCDWSIQKWSSSYSSGGFAEGCPGIGLEGSGWLLEVVHGAVATPELIAGCVGEGAQPSASVTAKLATLLRAQLLVLAEVRIRNESLSRAERQNREFQALVAEKQQPLSRLNTRFSRGFWDWELGDDSQWYSDRIIELLDYGLDGSFSSELDRLLAQSVPQSEAVAEKIRHCIARASQFDERLCIRAASRQIIWLRIRGASIAQGEDDFYSAGAIEDVSARVQLENERQVMADELERSNRDLETFAYVASHDLKAPLRHVVQLMQWVEEDAGQALPDECLEHFNQMGEQVGLMDQLLDSLLEYARVGSAAGRLSEVDLHKLTTQAIAFLGANQDIEIQLAGALPSVVADAVALEKCLRNLIDNAMKHANQDQPRIRVSVLSDGSDVLISVEDNGHGIPAEQHA